MGFIFANTGEEPKGRLSGAVLKWIALIAMTIDHIGVLIIIPVYNALLHRLPEQDVAQNGIEAFPHMYALFSIYWVCRMIGRLAFPIYGFLLVEGFRRTSNLKKYVISIAALAIISELPFDLAVYNNLSLQVFGYQNILFTMVFALLALVVIDKIRRIEVFSKLLKFCSYASFFVFGVGVYYLLATGFAGDMFVSYDKSLPGLILFTDLEFLKVACGMGCLTLTICLFLTVKIPQQRLMQFGLSCSAIFVAMMFADLSMSDFHAWGIFAIVLMYVMDRKSYMTRTAWGCTALIGFDFFQAVGLAAVFPVSKYSGERGKQKKYFFYIYYPAHLLALYGISHLVLNII